MHRKQRPDGPLWLHGMQAKQCDAMAQVLQRLQAVRWADTIVPVDALHRRNVHGVAAEMLALCA